MCFGVCRYTRAECETKRFLAIEVKSHKVDPGSPRDRGVFLLLSYKSLPLRRGSSWLCWWDHSIRAGPIWWGRSGTVAHPGSIPCQLQEEGDPRSGGGSAGWASSACASRRALLFQGARGAGRFAVNAPPGPHRGMRCSSLGEWPRCSESLGKPAGQVS